MIRALLLALALAACSSSPPPELPPPQLPQRAGIDPLVAARAEGVAFRAVGHAPDFVLHIYRDHRLFLSWDAHQQHFPATEPVLPAWNGEIYETQSDGHALRVEVRRTTCREAGGVETFPARVTIVIDGEERIGCGRDL